MQRIQKRLLQSFSARVLCDRSSPEWIELFTRSVAGHARFEAAVGAILCVNQGAAMEEGDAAELQADLLRIAAAHGGACDLLHATMALVLLPDAAAAFEAARQVQDLPCGRRLCLGLAAGCCEIASIDVRGGARRLFLGDTVERAQAIAAGAPAGTLGLCPALSPMLQPQIDALADRLVTTEIDERGVATVSLALPPRSTDLLSSFAGLGLVPTEDLR